MRVVADDKYEALKIAASVMPDNSQLSDINGQWRITRSMNGVWTVYIAGAADRARELKHIEPHSNTMWYEDGWSAAEAVNHGHHTAYGQTV
jgi:hypothetical protein